MKIFAVDARLLFASGIGSYLRNILTRIRPHIPAELGLIGNPEEIRKIFSDVMIIPERSNTYSPLWHLKAPFKIPPSRLFWSPHYSVPLTPVRSRSTITTIHDLFHIRFAHMYGPASRLYAKLLMKKALKSDRIITVSQFTKQEILDIFHVDEEKIHVIYNGVDTGLFRPSPSKETLRKYTIDKPYILYVGNIKPHKNLKTLVKAFDLIKDEEDVWLVIVGKIEGLKTPDMELLHLIEENPQLKDRIRILEHVPIEDLPAIYTHALFLVFPSLYEGFGLPPLEAIACGTPVILSDIPVLREIYGDDAPYFSPQNYRELADLMLQFIRNEKLRSATVDKLKHLPKKYSWEKSAMEHLNVFNGFLI